MGLRRVCSLLWTLMGLGCQWQAGSSIQVARAQMFSPSFFTSASQSNPAGGDEQHQDAQSPDPPSQVPARPLVQSQAASAEEAKILDDFNQAMIVLEPGLETAVAEGHDLFHVVVIYKARMKTEPLCTVESLMRALAEGTSTNPATVVMWVYSKEAMRTDHAEVLERVEELARSAARRLTLLLQEVTVDGVFEGTPFKEFYHNRSGAQLGTYGENNKVNALRIAVVYKFGGMYIDADMVFLRDPSSLPYGISTQTAGGKNRYNSAAFKLPKGHPMMEKFMTEFVTNYKGGKWGWQGPRLVTRVVFQFCPYEMDQKRKKQILRKKKPSQLCNFQSWNMKAAAHFLYMKWENQHGIVDLYLQDNKKRMQHMKDIEATTYMGFHDPNVYLLHLWHKISAEYDRGLCQNLTDTQYAVVPIARLRSERCPVVASLLRSDGITKCEI